MLLSFRFLKDRIDEDVTAVLLLVVGERAKLVKMNFQVRWENTLRWVCAGDRNRKLEGEKWVRIGRWGLGFHRRD